MAGWTKSSMLTEKRWTAMLSPVVDHIWNPSGGSILTTLHVEYVVFRREAHREGRKDTSACVPIDIALRARQVAWLVHYPETNEHDAAGLWLDDAGLQRSV
jgi:hypothetical protein